MRVLLTVVVVGNWLAGCFRHTPFFALFAAAIVCTSCSAPPKRSVIHYSAPSVAPVRAKISEARTSVTAAATSATRAQVAIAKADALLVGRDSVEPEHVPALRLQLSSASADLDALTHELTIAQTALAAAETNAAELQVKVETQTDQLNICGDEKNLALAASAQLQREKATLKQRLRVRHLIIGALLAWIFRRQLLGLGKMALRLFGIPIP